MNVSLARSWVVVAAYMLCGTIGCAVPNAGSATAELDSNAAPGPNDDGDPTIASPRSRADDPDSAADSKPSSSESNTGDPDVAIAAPRPNAAIERSSIELFLYQVELDVPKAIELRRGSKTASNYTGFTPDRGGFMMIDRVSIPAHRDEASPMPTPSAVAAQIATELGVADAKALGDGGALICSPEVHGREWRVDAGSTSAWIAIFVWDDDDPTPEGFAAHMGIAVVGGRPDSAFAADGEVVERVRASVRVTSRLDAEVNLGPDSCSS